MSTIELEYRHPSQSQLSESLRSLLGELETNDSIFLPENLWERLVALDQLDTRIENYLPEDGICHRTLTIQQRMQIIRTKLEATNSDLYQSIRDEIIRSGQVRELTHYLKALEAGSPHPGFGFDCEDDLLSGVLRLREPRGAETLTSREMVSYQPTPVRHVLHLISQASLVENDVFVDLGSGLGHVPLLVSLLTGTRSIGLEIQPSYVASSLECAQALNVTRAEFLAGDVRDADLSFGTTFYLYSPFSGSILNRVLQRLRAESFQRQIKVCSLGPCTQVIAREPWLRAATSPDTRRITLFELL